MQHPLKYILLLCIAGSFTAFSQKWEDISNARFREAMTRCGMQNNKENYSLDFNRQVFANARDAQPVSSSSGRLIRGKGKEYRLESEKQLLIQTKDIKMVIDSSESLILLLKPDTLFDQVNPEKWLSEQDLSSARFFSQTAGNAIRYKIEFKAGTSVYQNFILTLDSRTYAIAKAEFTLFAANYLSSDPEDISAEEPRIVVTYEKAVPLGSSKAYFDLSRWLRRSGNDYQLQPQITYTLDDLRIQTNLN